MAERIRIFEMEIEDQPGSLYGVLKSIAGAGLDLRCVGAVSMGGGKGMVYLAPKDAEAAKAYAEQMGVKPKEKTGIVLTCEDRVGAGAESLGPLSEAGINGVLCMAAVVDGSCIFMIVVDQEHGDAAAKAYGC